MKPIDYLGLLVPELLQHDQRVRGRYRVVLRKLVRQAVLIAYRTIQHSHDTNHVHRESHRISRMLIP